MSQEELADLAALHRTYVGAVERDERNPTLRSVSRMLDALGVSWAAFGAAVAEAQRVSGAAGGGRRGGARAPKGPRPR